MRVRVAEQVWVQAFDARCSRAAPQELGNPGLTEAALATKPQCRRGRVIALRARPHVAIKRPDRGRADGDVSRPASLAGDLRESGVEVDVDEVEAEQLAAPDPRVDEQPDDCSV